MSAELESVALAFEGAVVQVTGEPVILHHLRLLYADFLVADDGGDGPSYRVVGSASGSWYVEGGGIPEP